MSSSQDIKCLALSTTPQKMFTARLCLLLILNIFSVYVNAGPNSIPTKEEQADLLNNVQDVFEAIKDMVMDEGSMTDNSVADDVNKMVIRAQEHLKLIEELAVLKLSCKNNKACTSKAEPEIQKLLAESKISLKTCAERANTEIKNNSEQLNDDTVVATSRGQDFLDELRVCSQKSGLSVISCYKNVIATDAVPTKNVLLQAVNDHREAHKRAINARQTANECVDETLRVYQDRIARVLVDAITCQ